METIIKTAPLRFSFLNLFLSAKGKLPLYLDIQHNYSRVRHNMNLSNSPKTPLFIIGILLLIGISFFAGGKLLGRPGTAIQGVSTQKAQIPAPRAKQTLNREFAFSLKDDKGKEISKVKYIVESAELDDEIIVKGQRATAVKGRTFLIINLKLKNDYTKGIQINTRDYIRLTVNDSQEQLAPDIHNDPVQVQAISTKYTRVGFPINENSKNLTLHVGEIEGTKNTIKLNLR